MLCTATANTTKQLELLSRIEAQGAPQPPSIQSATSFRSHDEEHELPGVARRMSTPTITFIFGRKPCSLNVSTIESSSFKVEYHTLQPCPCSLQIRPRKSPQMSDFAPPTGPPPPWVPEGWKAVWNDQYQEYFYVNLHTKQSTWEKPTEPASAGGDMPPGYTSGGHAAPTDTKGHMGSNNPYNTESDEAMARRMQEEERARGSNHGANNNYYGSGSAPQQGGHSGAPEYAQHETGADRGHKSGGLMGKLKDKLQSGGAGGHHAGYPQQAYGGGYPQQGYGGHHGGYPQQPMGYGGGYGQPMMGGMGGGMYGHPVRQKRGMGAGGGAALGLGGGLLGGMMLGNAMDDDTGGDDMGGDDMGGGDMGGGDMGGDMGDMGGDM